MLRWELSFTVLLIKAGGAEGEERKEDRPESKGYGVTVRKLQSSKYPFVNSLNEYFNCNALSAKNRF